MTTINDFFVTVKTAFSNFWYDYDVYFWIIAGLLVAAGMIVMLVRANRCRIPFEGRYKCEPAENELVFHAAESLSKAITFETVTGNTQAMSEFREFLRLRYPLAHTRLNVEVVGGGSLLFVWHGQKTGRLPMLLAGHMDVVPAEGTWERPPFSGDRFDGKIWGRGSIDCKHIIISVMEAVEGMLREGFQPKRDIYLAFGHDEETGGHEGAASIAARLQSEGIELAMVLDEGGSIVNGYLGNHLAAAATVGVAEKGMFNLKITAKGTAGHASIPGKHTAIGILSEAVCRIEASPMRRRITPLMREHYKKSAGCMSFRQRFIAINLPLTTPLAKRAFSKNAQGAALLRTTFAATMADGGKAHNILPGSATVNLNIRLLHGDTRKSVVSYISDLLSGLQITLHEIPGSEPSAVSDHEGEYYQYVTKTIEERFGAIPVIPTLFNGATDARHYEKICKNVFRFSPFVFSPQQLSKMHAENENIGEETLGAAVEFYQMLIRRLA